MTSRDLPEILRNLVSFCWPLLAGQPTDVLASVAGCAEPTDANYCATLDVIEAMTSEAILN